MTDDPATPAREETLPKGVHAHILPDIDDPATSRVWSDGCVVTRLPDGSRVITPASVPAPAREERTCSCGHPFGAHTEYGTTARPNGPVTHRACRLCGCWAPKAMRR